MKLVQVLVKGNKEPGNKWQPISKGRMEVEGWESRLEISPLVGLSALVTLG